MQTIPVAMTASRTNDSTGSASERKAVPVAQEGIEKTPVVEESAIRRNVINQSDTVFEPDAVRPTDLEVEHVPASDERPVDFKKPPR